MVFAGYSVFLHFLQLASHELATIGIIVMKNEIPKVYVPKVAVELASVIFMKGVYIFSSYLA